MGEEVFYLLFDLGIFQEEAVVSVEGGDRAEEGAGDQGGEQLLFLQGEEDIGCYSYDEGSGAYLAECFFEAAAGSGYVV